MGVRAALAAAGALLATVVPPIDAAPPSGTITIQGSATAWTTIDLPAGVTLDYEKATVSTAGRFGGFYLDVPPDDGIGTVLLTEFHGPGDPAFNRGMGSGTGAVAKGRYRLYLVADGPTTVRVPVTGMGSRTFRPSKRTYAAASVQRLTPSGPTGLRARQPVNAARRSVSFSSLLQDDVHVFAGQFAVCLTSPETRCKGMWDGTHTAWYVNPYSDYSFVFTVSYAPGLKAGRLDAVQELFNAAGTTYAAGASFTLTLV